MSILKYVVVTVVTVALFGGTMLMVYDRAYDMGRLDGVAVGYKAALDTRTPSMELEFACAGLWFGEQLTIYEERNNAKR